MLNVNKPFLQEVIHENEQIYQRIAAEIKKAHKQILVVTAWFTDQTLCDILYDRAVDGVDVRVVISDIEDNKKLDFERLQNCGAKIYKIKNAGYGGMRTRFCVIDNQVAVHGSYNWSLNAQKNSQESVIVTDHIDTVAALIKQFQEMEREADGSVAVKEKWNVRLWFKTFWRKKHNGDGTQTVKTLHISLLVLNILLYIFFFIGDYLSASYHKWLGWYDFFAVLNFVLAALYITMLILRERLLHLYLLVFLFQIAAAIFFPRHNIILLVMIALNVASYSLYFLNSRRTAQG